MEEEGAPAAVVAALAAATAAGDWPLAGEAAWALELMGGMSRRLTSALGCALSVLWEWWLGAYLAAARTNKPCLASL